MSDNENGIKIFEFNINPQFEKINTNNIELKTPMSFEKNVKIVKLVNKFKNNLIKNTNLKSKLYSINHIKNNDKSRKNNKLLTNINNPDIKVNIKKFKKGKTLINRENKNFKNNYYQFNFSKTEFQNVTQKKNKLNLIYYKFPNYDKFKITRPFERIIIKDDYFCIGRNNIFFKQNLKINKDESLISPKQIEIILIKNDYFIRCNGINSLTSINLSYYCNFLINPDYIFLIKENNKKIFIKFDLIKPIGKTLFLNDKFTYFNSKYYSKENKIILIDFLTKKKISEEKNIEKFFEIIKDENNNFYIKNPKNLFLLIKGYNSLINNKKSEFLKIDKKIEFSIHEHTFIINNL